MKTNIMNLMMGTTGTQNTAGTSVEVDGALFSSLLQKVTGQGGIETGTVFGQGGTESVKKEEDLSLEEAAAALVGMIFSKMPEEMLQAKTPENILEEGIGLLKEAQGNLKNAQELQSVKGLLGSLESGDKKSYHAVLDLLKMKQEERSSLLGGNAVSGMKHQDVAQQGQKNGKDTIHEVAFRSILGNETHKAVSAAVDESSDAVERTENKASLQMENDVEKASGKSPAFSLKEQGELKDSEKIDLMQAGAEAVPAKEVRLSNGKAVKVTEHEMSQNLKITEDAMVKSMETLKNGDTTTMKLRLHPEELGEMELTLSMEHGKITGKLMTESQEIRQLFQGKLLELQENLKAQNIQVVKLEVSTNLSDQGQNFQGQNPQDEMKKRSQEMTLRGYGKITEKKSSYSPVALKSQEGISILA
ncbi:flagellar hook-length control protein FliK [Proteiniclasticum ruminis]|uniref:Hook-length control protein FliK n=1 Tax=Proteiniclasticum ruminis TaxID=398199 RepID=A0A1I5C915_9CLOT|nr:flagellar hook-length control protein FliK [Proteiniclasticum ruminis]SFN83513.1 hook-length control protein FliK [Proteiniclasticum ruminis]